MFPKFKKNIVYNLIFFFYLLFLFFIHYFLVLEIHYPQCFLELFVSRSSADFFHKMDISFLMNQDFKGFLLSFRLYNLIFNLLTFFIEDIFLIINLTPFIIFIIIVFLVYKIGSLQNNKLYGLLTAFLFCSFPIAIFQSRFSCYHLTETVYVLFAIYFYLKSRYSKNVFNLILSVCPLFFLFKGSGTLYMGIMFFLYFYFLIKKRKEEDIRVSLVGFFLILLVVLLVFYSVELSVFKGYVVRKLPKAERLFNSKDYIKNFLMYVFLIFPWRLYSIYLFPLYAILIPLLLLLNALCFRKKKLAEYEIIINYFIFIPLLAHIFNSQETCFAEETYVENVFLIFPFLSLKIINLFFLIREKPVELNKQNFLCKKIGYCLNKKGISTVFLIFFIIYGLSLQIPYTENTWLNNIADKLNLKKVIYVSEKNKILDKELSYMQYSLLYYLQAHLSREKDKKICMLRIGFSKNIAHLDRFKAKNYKGASFTLQHINGEFLEKKGISTGNFYLFINSEPLKLQDVVEHDLQLELSALEEYKYFVLIIDKGEELLLARIKEFFKEYNLGKFSLNKEFKFKLGERKLKVYVVER